MLKLSQGGNFYPIGCYIFWASSLNERVGYAHKPKLSDPQKNHILLFSLVGLGEDKHQIFQ